MSDEGPDPGPEQVAKPAPATTPEPAATVVLMRDRAEGGFEVLLVQRNQRIGFMGGMYVFPGGKLSAHDGDEGIRAQLMDSGAHAGAWGAAIDRAKSDALAVAAVRETFEEAGVLLAQAVDHVALPSQRARLLAGEPLASLLTEAGARLRLSMLVPFSRWITPAFEPRRYDTCFYLARAPVGQRAAHDQGETIAARWRSPADALQEAEEGAIRLSPPTARTLSTLAPCSSAEDAERLARSRMPPLVEPIIREIGDELVIFYPGDPEHPVDQRAFEGPTRAVLRRKSR